MAKDPAMLWYWGDWNSGTCLMSRFLKGCYMDLLHAQFNHGRLSLEDIKTCLGSDYGTAWPALQKKFKQDEKNLFFNERCELEKLRRAEFVSSRSNGKSGRKKSHDKSHDFHTDNHTENGNEDENKISNEIKFSLPKNGFFTDTLEPGLKLTTMQVNATIEYIRLMTKQVVTESDVGDRWEAFKIAEFSKHQWYSDFERLLSHFRNSYKLDFKNGSSKTTEAKSKLGNKSGGFGILAEALKSAG